MKKGTSSTLEEKIERERAKLFSSGSLEKIPELVQEMEDISGTSSSLVSREVSSGVFNILLERMDAK